MTRWLLAAGLLGIGSPLAWAWQVTDDRGVTVRLEHAPRRIVSLLPSLTETVCELGGCARLVGVDRYSNYPAAVRALPRVGGGIDPNIEAIVALRPELVLMTVSSRGAQRLEALGLRVLALETRNVADARSVFDKLGQVLEMPDAQSVWHAIDAGVAAAAQSLPLAARRLRVYYEVSGGPYGAGAGSFIGEIMARLGVRNILPPELGPFPKLNPEFIARADPDLIMIGQRNVQGLTRRPGWAGLRAIREQRVCVFTPEQSDVLVRPGPRMAESARIMAQCLLDKGVGRATGPAP